MPDSPLIELLYGQGAHANTLACVEDVPFEIAVRRDGKFPHSIWQLVWHMNFWMEYELARIREESPTYPAHASESWPVDARPARPDEWNEAVTRFRNNLAELAKLAASPPDILFKEVPALHRVQTENSSSLLAVLWQTVVHNTYHIGQVAMLRRESGAWPPKGGGDSW